MDRVLFVNACMRGEGQSRTLRLCQRFFVGVHCSSTPGGSPLPGPDGGGAARHDG